MLPPNIHTLADILCCNPTLKDLHVDTEDRDLALPNHWILILGCHNGQPLLLASLDLDEPAPTTALDTQQSDIKGFLKLVFVAPSCLDLLHKFGRGSALRVGRACWCEVQPEERVIDVTTTMELDSLLQSDLRCYIGGMHGFNLRLQSCIQVRNVGLMVLAVVQLHNLSGDVRFQCLCDY